VSGMNWLGGLMAERGGGSRVDDCGLGLKGGFKDSSLRLGRWFKIVVSGSNQFGRAAVRSAKDVAAEIFIENNSFATKDPTTI
ncbi:hypothetical protein BHE74_00049217, partial [Ensete ventricosum]